MTTTRTGTGPTGRRGANREPDRRGEHKARDYYDRQAKERQKANLKRGGESPVKATFPEREESPKNALLGKSRDLAGKTVGVSGRTDPPQGPDAGQIGPQRRAGATESPCGRRDVTC